MKKSNLSRIVSLLIIMLMVVGSFTGCGKTSEEAEGTTTEAVKKDDTTKTDDTKTDTTEAASGENKVVFPLEEQITLTCLIATRPDVDDFDNNEMTKKLEEMTNINFEFEVVNSAEAEQRLNLALSTGTYPDLILLPHLSAALQNLYGTQGMLLPMDELIADNGKNTRDVLERYPDILAYYTAQDGHMYNLPRIYDVTYSKCLEKLWIYQPWLDKLNLELPTTTEEFYEVLKAFKEQDPNGNGIADEIPMAGTDKSWAAGVRNYLMNAFVYYPENQGNANYLYVDNGTVVASYFQDEFKDGINYIAKLVDEGLISSESFTQDGDGLKRMGENPDDVILGAFPGGYQGIGVDMTGDRWTDYVAVEPLEGPNGVKLTKYTPDSIYAAGMSITDKCEYPDVAMALADLLYTEEMSIMNFDGVEGVDWQFVDDTTKMGVNGEPARWERLHDLQDNEPNFSWSQQGNAAYVAETMYTDDPLNVQIILYKETADKYMPYIPSMDMILKTYIYSEEESIDQVTYSTAINEFISLKTASYALNSENIDEDWDAFKSELVKMGAEDYIAIYQKAYDANK